MVAKVALTAIRRTVKPGVAATPTSPAQAPVVETVPAGTLFETEGDELSSLQDQDVICDPDDPRAQKYGFGQNGVTIKKEEGETEDSAAKRTAAAKSASVKKPAKGAASKDPLVAESDEDVVG